MSAVSSCVSSSSNICTRQNNDVFEKNDDFVVIGAVGAVRAVSFFDRHLETSLDAIYRHIKFVAQHLK